MKTAGDNLIESLELADAQRLEKDLVPMPRGEPPFTCPRCGQTGILSPLASYSCPPIYHPHCPRCSYQFDVKGTEGIKTIGDAEHEERMQKYEKGI